MSYISVNLLPSLWLLYDMKDKRYGEEGLWSLTELSGKPFTGCVIWSKLFHLSCSFLVFQLGLFGGIQ